MVVQFTHITDETLPAFLVYLLPQAAALLVSGSDAVAVGAVVDGHSCGAAVCSRDGGAHALESLFVDETARRRGLGAELLRRVLAAAEARWGHVRSVTARYILPPENCAVLDAFFVSQGFAVPRSSGNRMFCVNSADLRELPFLGAAFDAGFRENRHIVPFSALSKAQYDALEADDGIPDSLKPFHWQGHVLNQSSTVWMEDGRPLAYLLAYQGFDGELVMGPACKREGAPAEAFLALLQAMVNRTYYAFGRDFLCHIQTVNAHAARLVEALTRGRFTEYLCRETSRRC